MLLGLLLLFFREFLFRLIFLIAPKGFGMGRNVLPERRNALKAGLSADERAEVVLLLTGALNLQRVGKQPQRSFLRNAHNVNERNDQLSGERATRVSRGLLNGTL